MVLALIMNPTSGPTRSYDPRITDTSDGSTTGNTVPSVGVYSGEFHVGAVGRNSNHCSNTFNATALTYTAGKCIGAPVLLPGFARIANQSSTVQSVSIKCLTPSPGGPVDLILFSALPATVTGLADNVTFSVANTDIQTVQKPIVFDGFYPLGGCSIATIENVGKYFAITGNTQAYAVLVARGAVTVGTATDLSVTVDVIQD